MNAPKPEHDCIKWDGGNCYGRTCDACELERTTPVGSEVDEKDGEQAIWIALADALTSGAISRTQHESAASLLSALRTNRVRALEYVAASGRDLDNTQWEDLRELGARICGRCGGEGATECGVPGCPQPHDHWGHHRCATCSGAGLVP